MKLSQILKSIILVCATSAVASCDSIDCSLENTVACNIGFYNKNGEAVKINDTLDITAAGTDSILYNKGLGTSSVSIPMSYYQEADTLVLTIYGEDYEFQDWLVIKKTNVEHFESLDCPVKMFHTIHDVYHTNNIIDSVAISSPLVEYNNGENIKVYLHSGR